MFENKYHWIIDPEIFKWLVGLDQEFEVELAPLAKFINPIVF